VNTRGPRRVAVVTGTRAEYGLLHTVMSAIRRHPRLELQVVATGMHLLETFGHTVDDIVADGWTVDARVRMQFGKDEPLDQSLGLARGIVALARFFHERSTQIVVVLGDRIEAMAAALAATTTGRILAHLHGGDVAPGDFDEGLRHAITKLAHLHFAATAQAARRIVRLGERRDLVHNVGAPGLDHLLETLRDPAQRQPLDPPSALVVQHPSGRPAERERRTMRAILRAVEDAGLKPIVIYPNTDRGHAGILTAIEAARKRPRNRSLRIERSVPRDEYLRLLAGARVLVGNSSSGIIEAASAGTPAVNVGDRQAGRQRSGRSVVDCGETFEAIRTAIAAALRRRPRFAGRTCYGDGHAGARVADLLARTPIDDELRRKRITY